MYSETIKQGSNVTPKMDKHLIGHDSGCNQINIPNESVGQVIELINAGTYGVFARVDWSNCLEDDTTGIYSTANILLCSQSKNYCNKCGGKMREVKLFTSIINECIKCG